MKCEYCGGESPGRFCSRECWDAVNGFDEKLKAERSVEFRDKHEPALAEWVDGVRVGKRELPPLTIAALVALADRDYRLPAVVAWASERRTQRWIGNRLGISQQSACMLYSVARQVSQDQAVIK